MKIPITTIAWTPCYRIISSRYPAVNFFEKVATDPADWELLLEVERLTDPFSFPGNLKALELEDRLSGAGYGRVLPAFTLCEETGARFSTRDFGAYYAAKDLQTAVFETVHHRTLFMQATNEPAQDLDQLVILADVEGDLVDIRAMHSSLKEIYSATNYSESQKFAAHHRGNGSLGVVYQSVRHTSGECMAIWRARIVANPREDRHLSYRWDGSKITGYYDKHDYQSLS